MELRRTLLVGIFGLMTLNLATALAAVGLLVRMSPVIGTIVSENVQSLEATETMLAVLAGTPSGSLDAQATARFDRALKKSWDNVTELEERPALAAIAEAQKAALTGDLKARTEVISAVLQLSEINRRAMGIADDEARRQGDAGAWFAVLMAIVSLVISAFLGRRLVHKLVEPLGQLYRVLEAFRTGQHHRRCTAVDVPPEFRRIFESVNSLLDAKKG